MGDLTWLSSLGQGSLNAVAVAALVWIMRWIVRREREISDRWRAVAETEQANTRRVLDMQQRILDGQSRILAAVESLRTAGPVYYSGSYDGRGGSPESRTPPPASHSTH
jgi:hypothetical protein